MWDWLCVYILIYSKYTRQNGVQCLQCLQRFPPNLQWRLVDLSMWTLRSHKENHKPFMQSLWNVLAHPRLVLSFPATYLQFTCLELALQHEICFCSLGCLQLTIETISDLRQAHGSSDAILQAAAGSCAIWQEGVERLCGQRILDSQAEQHGDQLVRKSWSRSCYSHGFLWEGSHIPPLAIVQLLQGNFEGNPPCCGHFEDSYRVTH